MIQSTYLRMIIFLLFSILTPLLNKILQHQYYLMHIKRIYFVKLYMIPIPLIHIK